MRSVLRKSKSWLGKCGQCTAFLRLESFRSAPADILTAQQPLQRPAMVWDLQPFARERVERARSLFVGLGRAPGQQ